MPRPRIPRTLSVWMNGEKVGLWHAGGQVGHRFVYDDSWLQSEYARPISLSMPLRVSREPYRKGVEAFFEGLLPDNRSIRERIQRRYRTRSARAFDLLAEIGRDCVGALQLLPEDAEPAGIRSIQGQRLTRRQVADELERCLGHPGAAPDQSDGFRISLAGAQEKTALLWHEDAWHRPTGTTPTTHILKLPIGPAPAGIDLSTSVENEWLCGRILSAFGLPVSGSRMEKFGEHRVLVIERFDRQLAQDRTWWMRLPQEDMCQATGTPPACKYEGDGGPGILRIMELLRGSNQPIADREDFLRTQLVFWLLAATDGHAKNFSIFLLAGGGYRLTPRYDVLSAFPMMGGGRGQLAVQKARMAMAALGKSRHYRWNEITPRHWLETARQCGFAGMSEIMARVADQAPKVVETIEGSLPEDFPAAVADSILGGLRSQARRLASTRSG